MCGWWVICSHLKAYHTRAAPNPVPDESKHLDFAAIVLQKLQNASLRTACMLGNTSFFLYRMPSLRQDTALVTAMGGRACTCVWQHQRSLDSTPITDSIHAHCCWPPHNGPG